MSKKRTLLIIFIVGLLFRFVMLSYYHDSYLDTSRMMTHYEIAHQLAHGNGFVVDEGFLASAREINYKQQINNDFYKLNSQVKRTGVYSKPVISDVWGYAVLLSFMWRIFGIESFIPLQILQVTIDALMVLFIYGIALMLFKRRSVAIASSVLYAFYIPFIYMSSIANREIFANWGMIVASFLVLRALYERRSKDMWLAGIVIAFCCWFRPFIIYLPAVFLMYSVMINWRSVNVHLRVFAGTAVPILLLFVLPFAMIYNTHHGTYKFVSPTILSPMVWEGMGAYDNPYGFKDDDEALSARSKELGYYGTGYTKEFYETISGDVMKVVKEHPEAYLFFLYKNFGSALIIEPLMGEKIHYAHYIASGKKTIFDFILEHPITFIAKFFKYFLGWLMPLSAFASLIIWRKDFRIISILPMLYLSKVFIHAATRIDHRLILEGYFPVLVLCAALIAGLSDSGSKFLSQRCEID